MVDKKERVKITKHTKPEVAINRAGMPCASKLVYTTKTFAELRIRRMKSKPGNVYSELRKYKCRHCGGWHLTSEEQRKG
jgi:hypothetical protein